MIDNKIRPMIMNPYIYQQIKRIELEIKWMQRLLRTSYNAFNDMYADKSWSKRGWQRRYVRWCDFRARMAAKMGLYP